MRKRNPFDDRVSEITGRDTRVREEESVGGSAGQETHSHARNSLEVMQHAITEANTLPFTGAPSAEAVAVEWVNQSPILR